MKDVYNTADVDIIEETLNVEQHYRCHEATPDSAWALCVRHRATSVAQ